MKPNDNLVSELASKLATIAKKKKKISLCLTRLGEEEKEVAFRLNSALGVVPIQEAAERVRKVMERSMEMASIRKSTAMKNLWSSKTPEEREAWKLKIREGRIEKRKARVNCND